MLLTLGLALAASALASAARPAAAGASCAPVIVWHDVAYFGYPTSALRSQPVPGRRVRGAVEPACNDTGGAAGMPSPVGAWSIAGVSRQVALLSTGGIYVPAGVFVQQAGFPIRSRRPDDETRTCRVTAHLTVSGHALPEPPGVEVADVRSSRPVRLTDHRLFVLVDVRTRIVGLDRNGVPSIGSLQAVRMNAVRCGSEIVATRIVPAGPIAPPAAAEDVLGAHWRGDPGILHDRTTYIAAAIVAAAAAVVLLVRARRRPLAARRG